MFSKFLVNTFIKDNSNTNDEKVRGAYGVLGGSIGILINLILFVTKLLVGIFSSSIAVMADAFNNLSDAFSSIVTIVGFKLSNKPADKDHPFGHGRIEYISALVVAFFVMIVGIQFIKTSFSKIINPTETKFELIPFILLIISIFLKLWLSNFNKYIGKAINSSALKAAGIDALGDVFTSSCVAISFLVSKYTTLPLDGYFGVAVSLFIIYSGISLIKETLNPLLGEAPDPELVQKIKNMVLKYDNIMGIHDLIVHNYGPGRCIVSLHAEVPSDISIMDIHETIDAAEREVSKQLNLELVIHMDPISINDSEIKETFIEVKKIVDANPHTKSIHDFRIVGKDEVKNLIFDVVIDIEISNLDANLIKEEITNEIKKLHPLYNCIITVDREYA